MYKIYIEGFKNNCKFHFVNNLNRFVNSSYKQEHSILLENLTGKEREKLKYKLNAELRLVKDDFINLTNTRDVKYNVWFDEWKLKILPVLCKNYKHNYAFYLKSHPQEFISCMRTMSANIIENGSTEKAFIQELKFKILY